jgi:hypothetical protein
MPRTTSIEDALTLQREIIAEEVAAAFLAIYGNADKAEGTLDKYYRLKESCDKQFWREVVTAIAQMRD